MAELLVSAIIFVVLFLQCPLFYWYADMRPRDFVQM